MFSVLFEVCPRRERWEVYLDKAKLLRPELESVDGFVDNIRYRSLTRDSWILSLSNWRDEKAVVRWRTKMHHHQVQELGRNDILSDYHLRVGQVTKDSRLPEGFTLQEQRLDETEIGEGTAVTLIDARCPANWPEAMKATDWAQRLGLAASARFVSWDIFDAVLNPGDLILMITWQNRTIAEDFESSVVLPGESRLRRVRVVRDYGMYDRREAPQYFPDASERETIHP